MVNTAVITRRTCRLCGGGDLGEILSLGNLYVSDFVKENGKEGMRGPLDLVLCGNPDCGLLQLRHTAPQELLYARHYWYRSGISPAIVADLKELAELAIGMVGAEQSDVFLDIGANDGSLLQFARGVVRVGCEPANNLQENLKSHADRVIHDFWSRQAYERLGLPKAKIVTAIGMFYDMEDPNQFIRDAAMILDEKGVFIAQLMTLTPMIEKNDVGNICHEHLEYYSYPSLVRLFERNGLEIFKVEENLINGGSYRLFARKLKLGSIAYPEPRFDYAAFAGRLEENKKKTVGFIEREVRAGKTVYGYGASTKGNTILQYYGLDDSLVTAIADKNPEKFGTRTVGTNIPIVPEEDARRANPDYFFVLPYAFLSSFVERENGWLDGGGRFIVSIPEFRLVGKETTIE